MKVDPAIRCKAEKLEAAGKGAEEALLCYSKAAAKELALEQSCLAQGQEELSKRLAEAEKRAAEEGVACDTASDAESIGTDIELLAANTNASLSATLVSTQDAAETDAAKKLEAAAQYASRVANALSRLLEKPGQGNFPEDLSKAASDLQRSFEPDSAEEVARRIDEFVVNMVLSLSGCIRDPTNQWC